MSNPTAAILIIGNEILSGRTQDANIPFIAKKLSTVGISLAEARIVPDREDMIINAIRSLAQQYTYVFTTGGIGATHDDITATSIAKAFNQDVKFHEKAVRILKDYYQEQINDTRLRMALIPENAEIIENPVSAAPGFNIGNVFCLAGIPTVMQAMLDGLIPKLKTGTPYYTKTIKSFVLENDVANDLTVIQQKFSDLDIGSYPSFLAPGKFGVSFVVRGTNPDIIEQATTAICNMINAHGHTASVE